jgi:5-formyltetrahydrofolate cyclo-ligase
LDRNYLRATILSRRDRLSIQELTEKSRMITKRLWQLPAFYNSKSIFTYVNFRSEVITLPLVNQALERGMRVAVPLTLVVDKKLVAYQLTNPEVDLAPGYCGIPEPIIDRCSRIAPESIDTVILPGSVFDAQGGRLGYGGGYYDRFLTNEGPQALRIAVAFEVQVVDNVPIQEHDQRVHYLVTEERTIQIKDS